MSPGNGQPELLHARSSPDFSQGSPPFLPAFASRQASCFGMLIPAREHILYHAVPDRHFADNRGELAVAIVKPHATLGQSISRWLAEPVAERIGT